MYLRGRGREKEFDFYRKGDFRKGGSGFFVKSKELCNKVIFFLGIIL